MKIGISSASFYPTFTENAVDHIIELGFKNAEIFLNSECEFESAYVSALQNKLVLGGVDVISVHPYTSAIEALYFFTEYSRRMDDAVEKYKHYFHMAEVLGAKYFTFHGDRNIVGTNSRNLNPQLLDRHLEVFTRLSAAAREFGITITQENVSWCLSANPYYIRCLREELGDKIGFTLDIKQAHRAQVDVEEYIEAMGDRLLNVHISDSSMHNMCLLPGEGTIDFADFIKKLTNIGYNGALIIEVYSDAFNSFRQIKSSKILLENNIFK